MAYAGRVLTETLVLRAAVLGYFLALAGCRDLLLRHDEVDGEVAAEGRVGGGNDAALVVDGGTVVFHRRPGGLEMAIEEEGIEVARGSQIADQLGEGAGGTRVFGGKKKRGGGMGEGDGLCAGKEGHGTGSGTAGQDEAGRGVGG